MKSKNILVVEGYSTSVQYDETGEPLAGMVQVDFSVSLPTIPEEFAPSEPMSARVPIELEDLDRGLSKGELKSYVAKATDVMVIELDRNREEVKSQRRARRFAKQEAKQARLEAKAAKEAEAAK